MHTKLSLELSDAKMIAAAAEEFAASKGLNVVIAVVDDSTYLQYLIRMDGAGRMAGEGAIEKAQTAAEGGHPTTFFEEPLNAGRLSMVRMNVMPIEGGIPVVVDGQTVGAIGVSGVLPHLDGQIAQAGVDAFSAEASK